MGVGVINALAVEPSGAAIGQHQQVVGIVQVMPALAQHIAAKFLADLFSGVFHIGSRLNAVAAQDLRFGDVGGDNFRQGQKLSFQRGNGGRFQQGCAGGCHHHRVHHDMLCAVLPQLLGDHADQLLRADHTDLDSIRVDIRKHGIQLLR